MNHTLIRIVLTILEVFVGVGALAGGIALLTGVFAQGIPLTWLAGSPFRDYTIPGLVLAILVGGGMLFAAATVFVRHEWAMLVSATAGIFMMGFEVVEVASVDSKVGDELPLVAVLQTLYFVLGLAIFGLAAYLWWVEYRDRSVLSRQSSHA